MKRIHKLFTMAAMAYASSIVGNSHLYMNGSRNPSPLYDPKPRPLPELHRETKIFTIHGVKIEAYSRKDAIARYKHMKKIKHI